MSLRDKLLHISKSVFFVLIFLIPVNLGKHYELLDSYVWGILVDYLIPTIYVQDILVILILLFWLLSYGFRDIFKKMGTLLERSDVQISILFIFSLFISVLSSVRFTPSLYVWLRVFLYFSLFLYILIEIPVEDYFFKILNVLSVSVLLVSVLGILQYLNKGSVFNSYLIFGEQPYSASTYGIIVQNFFNKSVIPAYGLFRHPNTFGGFLSLSLIWIFSFLKKSRFYYVSFFFGVLALIFTFSLSAWLVFIFGVFLHIIFSKNPNKIKLKKRAATFLIILFCVFMIFIPVFSSLSQSENPSIYRRSNFIKSSYRMIKDFPIFGVGLNNSTILMDGYNLESNDIQFTQPVHNIFLLTFSESGLFSFLLFISFLYFSGKRLLNSSYFHLFLISFLQILVLGSFDHYLFTAHQTHLLFWVVLGLALQ